MLDDTVLFDIFDVACQVNTFALARSFWFYYQRLPSKIFDELCSILG